MTIFSAYPRFHSVAVPMHHQNLIDCTCYQNKNCTISYNTIFVINLNIKFLCFFCNLKQNSFFFDCSKFHKIQIFLISFTKYIFILPIFFTSISPRYSQAKLSFIKAYVFSEMFILPSSELDSILEAMFTVSPQMS
ncbi:hypothetical protein SAMN05444355_10553 [Flavobacterium frigoris]|uniref:Uncharacterized protein n=1 Tax=Flavobacterium frigoris TaxID=229204 RepID=A0A1H9JTS8_FLAFI|nr:hypothetical protein SAMN05444355_10553 [Flavobacterium frigoris]